MKNWKTSLGGILASVGILLAGSDDATMKAVGQFLGATGVLITGLGGKDSNVTGGTKQQ